MSEAETSATRSEPAADAAREFERIYALQLPDLLGFALRRCESREDAADLVAEVFLVAWRRFADLPRGEQTRLWLFGVAQRALANQSRAERRRRNLGAALAGQLAEAGSPDPASVFEHGDEVRAVRQGLDSLAEVDRALITLTSWEALTVAEAAKVLGLSAGAARVRLHRARTRLRRVLYDEVPARGRDLVAEPGAAADSPTSATSPVLKEH